MPQRFLPKTQNFADRDIKRALQDISDNVMLNHSYPTSATSDGNPNDFSVKLDGSTFAVNASGIWKEIALNPFNTNGQLDTGDLQHFALMVG